MKKEKYKTVCLFRLRGYDKCETCMHNKHIGDISKGIIGIWVSIEDGDECPYYNENYVNTKRGKK